MNGQELAPLAGGESSRRLEDAAWLRDSHVVRGRDTSLLCATCHYWIHGKENTARLFLGKGHN
jgi:hypothetical protein